MASWDSQNIFIGPNKAADDIEACWNALLKSSSYGQPYTSLFLEDNNHTRRDTDAFSANRKLAHTAASLLLLPGLSELYISTVNFEAIPSFQTFLNPLKSATKLRIVRLSKSRISINNLLNLIDSTGLMMRQGDLSIGNMYFADYDPTLLPGISFDNPDIDPPSLRHEVRLEQRVYNTSPDSKWSLELVLGYPSDHWFMEVLPSTKFPLHTVGTLDIQAHFLSRLLTMRINRLLNSLPMLTVLKLDFDDGRCHENFENLTLLEIPAHLQLLRIHLGIFRRPRRHAVSRTTLVEWWTANFERENMPHISKLQIDVDFEGTNPEFEVDPLWERLDSAMVAFQVGQVQGPAYDDEDDRHKECMERFYELALPRTAEKYCLWASGMLISDDSDDSDDSDEMNTSGVDG